MSSSSVSNTAADAFLEEHRELMTRIGQLRQFWTEVRDLGQGPQYEEMACGVGTVRDILAHHFAEEEREGYLKPALDRAPQFSLLAETLQHQHAGFLQWLALFYDRLMCCDFESWEQVHSELEEFLDRLKRHEAEENRIVQSAFNDDLGSGD